MRRTVAWLRRFERPGSWGPVVAFRSWLRPTSDEVEREVDVPPGYYFHPSHSWVFVEGDETVRVGMDSFAVTYLGEIEKIEVVGLNRWVRQGQRLMTVSGAGGIAIELLSPSEGEIRVLNGAALQDPAQVVARPYEHGWIALIHTPHIVTDLKNLIQGAMAEIWMRNNRARLKQEVLELSPALAEYSALPLEELLARMTPQRKGELAKQYFAAACVSGAQEASRIPCGRFPLAGRFAFFQPRRCRASIPRKCLAKAR